MDAEQNIANIINLLKGESSFWVNKQNMTKDKFGWQDDYFATKKPTIRRKHFSKNMMNL